MLDMEEKFQRHRDWVSSLYRDGEPLVAADVSFCDYDFADAVLAEACLIASHLEGMNLKKLHFYKTLLSFSYCQNAVMENCRFYQTDLEGADFTGANIVRSSFDGCDCEDTIFSKTIMRDCSLVNTRLGGAHFTNAILCNVDISGAVFEETVLTGVDLNKIKGIRKAIFRSINIGSAKQPILLESEEAKKWILSHNIR